MGRRKTRGKKKVFKFTALGSSSRQVKMEDVLVTPKELEEERELLRRRNEEYDQHCPRQEEYSESRHGYVNASCTSGVTPKDFHHLHFEQEVGSDSDGEQDPKKVRREAPKPFPPDFEKDPILRDEFERCSSSSSLGSALENLPDEPVVDKCNLEEGNHGVKMCLSPKICDLCYLAGIRNFGRPANQRMSAFCFKIPSLLQDADDVGRGPKSGVEYPIMEAAGVVEGRAESVQFNMGTNLADCPGSVIADLAQLALSSAFAPPEEEEDEEEADEDPVSTEQAGVCCGQKSFCCMHDRTDGPRLRGMKDWRPEGLAFHDQQFILRQAKKYQVDSKISRLLQFILVSLKSAGDAEGGMAPKQVPKFARTKAQRKKIYTRKDFPKFDLPKMSADYMMRPYAYLELLDHNKEDGLLLITLAEMIGISKRKDEMILVFEKNFGFDCRIEQFKEDEKKRHHPTGNAKKK